jgi:ACS family pantothenate transporter-like MFS transporter
MTWATETISSDMQVRAMAIAIMNTSSSLTWTWTSLLLWPVTDAPYYRKILSKEQFYTKLIHYIR